MVPSLDGLAPFQFAFVVRDLDRRSGDIVRNVLGEFFLCSPMISTTG
jgi:hypothetical protein